MNYKLEKSGTIIGNRITPQSGAARFSANAASASWRDTAKRNFILQMGFENPVPSARSQQYSALVFQPKVVLVTVVAGIVFQSPAVFVALGAVLCGAPCFRD